MAIPNPTLQGLSGLEFLMTAETGMIISSRTYTASGTREDVYDASLGYDVGFVEFNFQLEGSVTGKYSANSGPGAAIPGAAVTLGNSTSYNGITSGGVYCTTVTGNHGEKGFREVTCNFLKKPGIA